eukprot:3122210-Pyramimonas_sp.AAC.1
MGLEALAQALAGPRAAGPTLRPQRPGGHSPACVWLQPGSTSHGGARRWPQCRRSGRLNQGRACCTSCWWRAYAPLLR